MRALVLLLLLVLAVAAAASPAPRFPGRSWDRARPNDLGFDEAKLKEAIDYAFERPLSRSYCVAVFKDGLLVADRYEEGRRPHDTTIAWSTSKAVMISIIGMLERQGRLRRAERVCRYIPELCDDAPTLQVDHLLRMSSGREYDPQRLRTPPGTIS